MPASDPTGPRTSARTSAFTARGGPHSVLRSFSMASFPKPSIPVGSWRRAGGCRRVRLAGWRELGRWLGVWLCLGWMTSVRAELQFDVFVGYGSGGGNDGIVREAGWFPVACEVFNDGPGFDAVFELSSRQFGAGQVRRYAIELPTNTRKRFSFPMFSGSRYASWDARLVDGKGKVRAEHTELRTRDLAWETFLLGGVPNSFGGLPAFPAAKHNRPDQQPAVARLTVEQFPDNPIALEGLDALYLSSAKAVDLKEPQARALVAWVQGGGHLVVAPEQLTDVSGTPWLAALLPMELEAVVPTPAGGGLHQWLTSPVAPAPRNVATPGGARRPGGAAAAGGADPYTRLPADPAFGAGEMSLFTGRLRDGEVRLAAGGRPVVVSATRGRGMVTLLTFSPEREPFRSWTQKTWFWARLFDIPGAWFGDVQQNVYGGWSLDAVFGAMVETRQVRKLPVEWLLVLLLVYLVVIGPFDRWFLKKLNRQMLTWLTFPAYVVFFSLLIYYIGFRLRAGETEWNEVHVVDVLPRGEQQALLRGRTFASLYSSSNARYPLASDQAHAALRSEFLGPSGGRQEAARLEAVLKPAGFQAEVAVPVWSSLLYVNDWLEPGSLPLSARVGAVSGGQVVVTIENRLNRPLTGLQVVVEDRLFPLGDLAAGQSREDRLSLSSGTPVADFVRNQQAGFLSAAQQRHRAFGGGDSGRLELGPPSLVAASLIGTGGASPFGAAPVPGGQRAFVYPRGTDLAGLVGRGQAVVFGFDAGHSPVASPLARFKAPRSDRSTFYRLAVTPASGG